MGGAEDRWVQIARETAMRNGLKKIGVLAMLGLD